MKTVIIGLAGMFVFFSSIARADGIEQRLAELENKIKALETVVSEKLGKCEMTYRPQAYRLNRCDAGTFARSVTDVGGGAIQLECGYYQLQCFKALP